MVSSRSHGRIPPAPLYHIRTAVVLLLVFSLLITQLVALMTDDLNPMVARAGFRRKVRRRGGSKW
jgi:hypothetical protein